MLKIYPKLPKRADAKKKVETSQPHHNFHHSVVHKIMLVAGLFADRYTNSPLGSHKELVNKLIVDQALEAAQTFTQAQRDWFSAESMLVDGLNSDELTALAFVAGAVFGRLSLERQRKPKRKQNDQTKVQAQE